MSTLSTTVWDRTFSGLLPAVEKAEMLVDGWDGLQIRAVGFKFVLFTIPCWSVPLRQGGAVGLRKGLSCVWSLP